MLSQKWKYYNHAIIPTSTPHEIVDTTLVERGDIWKLYGKKALFVRWTSNFDCGFETGWWYCIKDTDFDINALKSKRRYEITSGLKFCYAEKINPEKYTEDIFRCYKLANEEYKNTGKVIDKKVFLNNLIEDSKNRNKEYWGVFLKETKEMVGYAYNNVFGQYVDFTTIKFIPQYLHYKSSAVLVYAMLMEYRNKQKKRYINDGERSISHKTNFQEYLIKYFGFRKAYCMLHIKYRMIIKIVVYILYPFRRILLKMDKYHLFHYINAVLQMEEIVRKQKME